LFFGAVSTKAGSNGNAETQMANSPNLNNLLIVPNQSGQEIA
jgi:hypothetical protein